MNINRKHLILAVGLLLTAVWKPGPQALALGGLPQWTNFYNGPAYADYATAIGVDRDGNVFVAGYSASSNNAPYNYDYVTVAYSSGGKPLWTNRYNGPGNSDDVVVGLAVVTNGNVVVTGYSTGNSGDLDYATVAYSRTGVPLWTNRYDGPGHSNDLAYAVAADTSGNVFVTGRSYVAFSVYDFATIKYSSAGTALWTNRFNRLGNNQNEPHGIAVDSSGNVFATGYSLGGAGFYDFATIACSSAGVGLWTNFYNGPANGFDVANAVAVGSNGNAVVTGISLGSSNGYDYATIAYSSAGVPLWTNRYNGPGNDYEQPRAVAVDNTGNVFVAGYSTGSGTGYDYATVAYTSSGTPLWTNRYNGTGNGDDYLNAMALDRSGNVFVTGYSLGTNSTDYATVAYSNAGLPLWTNRYNVGRATALALDRNGRLFVTGNNSNYVTLRYPSSFPSVHLEIQRDASGDIFIRFNGVPDADYRLQRAGNIQGPWNTSGPLTAPASGLVEFWDLFPPAGQGFYRVVQLY